MPSKVDILLDIVEESYSRLHVGWSRTLINKIITVGKAEEEKRGGTIFDSILEDGIREANSRIRRVENRYKKFEDVCQCDRMQCFKCNARCEITELAIQGSNMLCLKCVNPSNDDIYIIRSGVINEMKALVKKFTGTHCAVAGYAETDFVCVQVFEELRAKEVEADEWPFDYATEKKIFSNSKLVMEMNGDFYKDTYVQIKNTTEVFKDEYTKWKAAYERLR